jgi:hypothetical protein
MNRSYAPIRPIVRCILAAVALADWALFLRLADAARIIVVRLTRPRSTPAIDLTPQAVIEVRARVGQRICCTAGSLWITQDGDPKDHILGQGQIFCADRRGRLLAYALEQSRMTLEV